MRVVLGHLAVLDLVPELSSSAETMLHHNGQTSRQCRSSCKCHDAPPATRGGGSGWGGRLAVKSTSYLGEGTAKVEGRVDELPESEKDAQGPDRDFGTRKAGKCQKCTKHAYTSLGQASRNELAM